MVIQLDPFIQHLGYNYFSEEQETETASRHDEPSQQTSDGTAAYANAVNADILRKLLEDRFHPGLSTILQKGIQENHKVVRENPFLLSLIRGDFCSKTYTLYLCNLFVIHQALEAAQVEITEKYGEGYFVFEELFRSKDLLANIQLWSQFNDLAPRFAAVDRKNPEFEGLVESYTEQITHDYVRHIRSICNDDPINVVGALYSEYGGILAGGQLIKTGVMKWFLIDHNNEDVKHSASFYDFPFDVAAFKQQWHRNLDDLTFHLRFDEESKRSFEQKMTNETNLLIQKEIQLIASIQQRVQQGRV